MSSEHPVMRFTSIGEALIRVIISSLIIVTVQKERPLFAEFNPAGWKFYRAVEVPPSIPKGFVAVGLESSVIQECLPDMADLRMAASDGSEVPLLIELPSTTEEPAALKARVFRIVKRPGEWTDVWIDKTAKVLSCGIKIQTTSKDFLRKVEIRGSDNDRDTYVIRLDGLIARKSAPVNFSSLDIRHPLNNFQYIQVRILDEGRPSLNIGGVVCHHPSSRTNPMVPVKARIINSRSSRTDGSLTMVADLGKVRFPVVSLAISSTAKEFITQVTITGSHMPGAHTWGKVYKGTFFRIHKGNVVKERLQANFRPITYRYVKLEMSSGTPVSLVVDNIRVSTAVPMAIFQHKPGRNYVLYYGNPKASARPIITGPTPTDPAAILAASSNIKLGRVKNYIAPAATREAVTPQKQRLTIPSGVRSVAGVVLLLAGLLLLFNIMLRSRSRRKRSGNRFSVK
jgi:hypothetical protein